MRLDIDHLAALGLTSAVRGTASEYEQLFARYGAAVDAIRTSLALSDLVDVAVQGFAVSAATPALTRIAGHTDSAIHGTETAVAAYWNGDREMAATAERLAAGTHYPAEMPGGRSAAPLRLHGTRPALGGEH